MALLPFLYLNSEEKNLSHKISLSEFKNHDSESNPAIEKEIMESLENKLRGTGYSSIHTKGNSLDERIASAKTTGSLFHIEGFYDFHGVGGNLNVYMQVYDPDTGSIIDAYTVNDEIYQLDGIKLDSQELKKTNQERIEKISDRTLHLIRSNPNKRENRENLEQYGLSSRIGYKIKDKIGSNNRAAEDAAAQVFDLLQGQITTSATKTKKTTSEAPNIVSVIQNKEIQDYGRVSINDILYNLPGFSPGHINDRRTVNARGMYEGWNNNHLLMLVDGIQFNDSYYGSALTWEVTPLNMIKSMEVIRGPGSALYGSNATNGVISLNTYSGSDLKGEIRLKVRGGNEGTRIYDVLTGNTGKIFSHTLSYNSYSTNGNTTPNYDGSGRTNVFGYLEKFYPKDKRDNYYIFAKLEGEGVLKGLSFQYHRQAYNYGTFNGWLQSTPDIKDKNSEGRDVYVAKYTGNIGEKLTQEYVVRFSNSYWDYNVRTFPPSSKYPAGVWENLNNSLSNIFGRSQLTYLFGNGGSIVGGVEVNQINYNGDKEHNSNADLNLLGTGLPNPNNAFFPLGPSMDWITKKPIRKWAPFAQVSSGRLFDRKVEFTLGVRYDETSTHFRGIDMPLVKETGYPAINIYDPNSGNNFSTVVPTRYLGPPYVTNEKKIYRKTSPRLGIVLFAAKSLTLKAMGGVAFREPSPGELYGVNTYVGGSNNPRKISPEIIKTNELAADYFFNQYVNIRVNLFQTRFENVIDYNGSSNAVSNVYTIGTRGVESEILFLYKNLSAFINYSRFNRYLDNNLDASVSKHPKEVTITPASTINFGSSLHLEKWVFSFSVHRQGNVTRKTSDLGKIDPITGISLENTYSNPYTYPRYRPEIVPAWTNLNLRLMFKISENMQIGFNVLNALNSYQTLVQRSNYPFDYIREGRRFLFEFSASF